MPIIIAIDGPSGSGKGTIAKEIAKRLGYMSLDTGAMYRCVALETLRQKVSLQDENRIVEIANNIRIEFQEAEKQNRVFLNGEEVTNNIRTKEINNIVANISKITPLREKLVTLQRKIAENKNIVIEGRDIGTVVFPDADFKFYLDADLEERAKRRYKEEKEKGMLPSYNEVLENLKIRDNVDNTRKVGSLKKAKDAVIIDSTNMTIEEVIEKIYKIIRGEKNA